MKKKNLFTRSAMVVMAGLLFSAAITSCNKDDDPTPAAGNTITDKVVADGNLTLLEQAVVRAGLDGTLKGTGPFTVFAPDDAAFAASGISSAAGNTRYHQK